MWEPDSHGCSRPTPVLPPAHLPQIHSLQGRVSHVWTNPDPRLPSPPGRLAQALTRWIVAGTLGTGSLGRDVWKLYSMGRPLDRRRTHICGCRAESVRLGSGEEKGNKLGTLRSWVLSSQNQDTPMHQAPVPPACPLKPRTLGVVLGPQTRPFPQLLLTAQALVKRLVLPCISNIQPW